MFFNRGLGGFADGFPNVIDDKSEQFWNALLPIIVTEFGIFILFRLMQFWNTLGPIDDMS